MPIAPLHKSWLDIDVSPMVPDEFAQFRPVIGDAIAYFLERLPLPRLTELVARQCDLPADASAQERLANLISQCPTLHKLGQVVARGPATLFRAPEASADPRNDGAYDTCCHCNADH